MKRNLFTETQINRWMERLNATQQEQIDNVLKMFRVTTYDMSTPNPTPRT
jgi:hypothetical protein